MEETYQELLDWETRVMDNDMIDHEITEFD